MFDTLKGLLNWMTHREAKTTRVKLDTRNQCWATFSEVQAAHAIVYDFRLENLVLKDVTLHVVKYPDHCGKSDHVGYAEGKPVSAETWTPDVSLARSFYYNKRDLKFEMSGREVKRVKYLWLMKDNTAMAIE